MADTAATPPSVSWAQDYSRIFLTFNVECLKPKLHIEKQLVSFNGVCAPDKKSHAVEITLFSEIDPERSTQVNKGRYIEVVLVKASIEQTFWPALTSDKKKHHWLKVDFNRWQDEDWSGDDCDHMSDMFSNTLGDFGDENERDESSSSEEEDLPDVQ